MTPKEIAEEALTEVVEVRHPVRCGRAGTGRAPAATGGCRLGIQRTQARASRKEMKEHERAREIGYAEGFKDGRRDGARRERIKLRRVVRVAMTESKHEHCNTCWYLGEIILEEIAARAKAKEGSK